MCGYARAVCLHATLLLAVVSGAGLATGARLAWDPSTYVLVRELFPREYRLAAKLLPAAATAQLALAHLALVALTAALRPLAQRILLTAYAVLTLALVCGEAWCASQVVRAVQQWVHSNEAIALFNALEIRRHLDFLLEYFARLYPFPRKVQDIIEEAEKDLPVNLYVAGAVCALLVVLQLLAAAAALGHATSLLPAPRRPSAPPAYRYLRDSRSDDGRATFDRTPRTAYRRGKLVIL